MQTFVNLFFAWKMFPSLYLGVFIYAGTMPRKRHFWLLFAAGLVLGTVAYHFLWRWAVALVAMLPTVMFYILLIAVEVVLFVAVWQYLRLMIKSSFWVALFCTAGGFFIEHVCSSISLLIGVAASLDGIYYEDYGYAYFGVTLAVYIVGYLSMFFVLRYQSGKGEMHLKSVSLIVPVLLLLVSYTVLSISTLGMADMPFAVGISKAYDVICSVFGIYALNSAMEFGQNRYQLEALEEMDRQRAAQYEISKDAIDLINTRCHDLRKMMGSSATGTSREVSSEIKEEIDVYDASIQTGNSAFDTVAGERSLYCQAHGITLTVMADGEAMSFLTDIEIYSLFGNILDNAVEAVLKVEEDRRTISLTVRRDCAILRIHSENYYEGEVTFSDGLPVTSKEDRKNHGYGSLSIRRTAEKRSGGVSMAAEAGIFSVDVAIPIPPESSEKAAENG